jgi:predicted GIY-YIG superfamily endonuclease
MNAPRDHWRYRLKQGNKVVHNGITTDPEQREQAHQRQFPNSRVVVEGPAVTEETARDWESRQPKTETPPRKK